MGRADRFDLQPGTVLAGKYRIEAFLGRGWEGEVYRVVEIPTGITRAAKLFYPVRNPLNRTAKRYARQLDSLRACPVVIQYHHTEAVELDERRVTAMISEFVDGVRLSQLPHDRSGRQLTPFEAIHLLHTLLSGLETIHDAGLYHGDLHSDNVLVRRVGTAFGVKLFDFFHRGRPGRWAQQDDLVDAVKLFHEVLGGRRTYARHPAWVKRICCGLKRSLILARYPNAARLRRHLETFEW
ncbi:MAG: protein kinase domain-containing protein [Thermoanaerobaculia bacterium]